MQRISHELKQTAHRYSELETAHRALGRSEELYRGLFNSMTEGIALHEIVPGFDGGPGGYRFLEVNPAFERLTGLKREDAVGRTVAEVLSAADPFWERIYGEAALLGTPARFENRSEKLNRDYEVFVYRPGLGRIAVILMDVGDRKRYERQLRDSREDLKRAQAVAHTGSWRLDLVNKKIGWSDEARRIFGVPPGTALSFDTFLDRVHPDERRTVARKWQDALKDGGPYEVEHRIVVDGGVKWVRERAELEVAENGAVLGGFGTTQDITALKRASEDAEKSLRRFELLTATAGELLRTAVPGEAVDSLCRKVMRHLDCDIFVNFLKDRESGRMCLNAWEGVAPKEAWRIERRDHGMAAAAGGVRDGDPRAGEQAHAARDTRAGLLGSFGIKAYVCFPLWGVDRGVDGTLAFGSRGRDRFRPDELSLIEAVADQLAAALRRVEGERALREVLALLDAIFDAAPVGLGFWDRGLRFVRLNRALAEINGLSVEEHLGRTPEEILPGLRGVPDLMLAWREIVDTGKPVLGVEISGRTPAFPDEDRHWMENWFPVTVAGKTIGVAATVMDITARRKAEEETRLSHSRLEETVRERTAQLENAIRAMETEIDERRKIQGRLLQLSRVFMDATDPIIIEDLSGRIVEANREAEAAYGWSRAELIGRPVADIVPPERRAGAEKLRQLCRRGEEVRDWEGVRQHRSGKTISTLLAAFPLLNESGEVTAVITMAKNISARKQMEARLTESRRRLQEISRRTVHALETDRRYVSRELHDSIGGNLAALKFILEESLDKTGEDSSAFASLLKAIAFLSQTIKESKRIAANLRPLTLDDLGILATLRGYLKQFGEQYTHIEVVPRIDLSEEDVAEEHKITIYRILQEALTNVAKHAKADRVEIGLRSDGEVMTLEVKDNGLGFDPQALEFRDDPLGGLGLKNMRERVEICRGTISIESGDGRGTHLRVTLPVAVHQTDAPGGGFEPS